MKVCNHCGAACRVDDRFCAACGSSLVSEGSSGPDDPLVGRTIGGAYHIQEIVGVGGMGRVYRAEQRALGRTVAIKVIHPHLLGDEQTVARFYTEARAASRLNHPNSVSIIDFGRTDDGILYLAMEFITGEDLASVLHDEGPLPFLRVIDILLGVLDALGEAHALDIVHRDLKPENVILRPLRTGGDLVKVVDFGLATIVGGQSSVTKPGLVCGTPDYMPPEQGRGDPVDGRGDLYALGVVLYELLTDALPFEDETPTKVVLRHINDPVPDPRAAAPHRDMPEGLAAITMKALAKDPAHRFQDAAAFATALKEERRLLASNKAPEVSCPRCGAPNPGNMRFCGSCGGRLTGQVARVATPGRGSSRPKPMSFYPPVSESEFIGRSAELGLIEQLRERVRGRLVRMDLWGEVGVGRSRLLQEIGRRFSEREDLVVGAASHPTALIPYFAVRTLVSRLLDIPLNEVDQLGALATDKKVGDALARAGFLELVEPTGVPGREGVGRVPAVAAALAWAIDHAMHEHQASRTILLLDDLDRCDGLTHEVLVALDDQLDGKSVMLVTTQVGRPAGARASNVPPVEGEPLVEHLELRGIPGDEARKLLAPEQVETLGLELDGQRRYLPLYVEQLRGLGHSADRPPSRLADAVAQRVERLSLPSQRVLQGLAAFGGRAAIGDLRAVVDDQDFQGLDELTKRGLVRAAGADLEVAHPFVAELVEAFIPAQARQELHRQILHVVTARGAPLEVRSEHAYRGAEPMRTLMLLERAGDRAMERGDPRSSILSYRRALELARRETLESGDAVMDTAVVTFSRKLGEALALAGDPAGGDGVVREVLDLTRHDDSMAARMRLALGKIAILRDRPRDAMRHLGKSLELVAGVDPAVEWEVQAALADVRTAGGDLSGAANALRRALQLLEEIEAPAFRRAATALRLVTVLVEEQADDEAALHLAASRRLVEAAKMPSLEALALGLEGRLAQRRGELERSFERYASAVEASASAGDAPSQRRWAEAARALAT